MPDPWTLLFFSKTPPLPSPALSTTPPHQIGPPLQSPIDSRRSEE